MTSRDSNDPATHSSEASEIIIDAGPEHRPERATELLRAEAGNVQANTVTMERSGAEQITAERMVMTNSGARTIDARSAQIDRSGVLGVKSDKAVFYNSTVLAAAVDEARIVRGKVLLLKADTVTVEGDARIGVLAGRGCNAVRPLVDVQGAAAFGTAAGAVIVVLGALVRRVFGRR